MRRVIAFPTHSEAEAGTRTVDYALPILSNRCVQQRAVCPNKGRLTVSRRLLADSLYLLPGYGIHACALNVTPLQLDHHERSVYTGAWSFGACP